MTNRLPPILYQNGSYDVVLVFVTLTKNHMSNMLTLNIKSMNFMGSIMLRIM